MHETVYRRRDGNDGECTKTSRMGGETRTKGGKRPLTVGPIRIVDAESDCQLGIREDGQRLEGKDIRIRYMSISLVFARTFYRNNISTKRDCQATLGIRPCVA